MTTETATLTRKDLQTDQEVRWCPGCGDYAILASVQKMMPKLGIARENFVVISGIGCSSRFPYYMNTYGFHTIHGRAPAVATGVSLANPDLSVWVVTGDGDGLSIGGNHLIHALRRNVNLKILLFNNRIYGLTKGQYSPTSEHGKRTKSTPMGSVDAPFNPVAVALGANASFVARAYDRDPKNLEAVLLRAAAHRGSAFVEIFQNCNVFNDGAFEHFVDKAHKTERQLWLEHGKPMVYGPNKEWGLRFNTQTYRPEMVKVEDVGIDALMMHDEKNPGVLCASLAQMEPPDGPAVLGVFRDMERPTYESEVFEQIRQAKSRGTRSLDDLLRSGDTWEVTSTPEGNGRI